MIMSSIFSLQVQLKAKKRLYNMIDVLHEGNIPWYSLYLIHSLVSKDIPFSTYAMTRINDRKVLSNLIYYIGSWCHIWFNLFLCSTGAELFFNFNIMCVEDEYIPKVLLMLSFLLQGRYVPFISSTVCF